MKISSFDVDHYLLNKSPRLIREFFRAVVELDPGFKYDNPEYYQERQRELESLHQPFLPKQYGDIYKLSFPGLIDRLEALKNKIGQDSDFQSIITNFKILNLLGHHYQQLKEKNEETNFGLLGKNSSLATSRKLDDFFTESFLQIHFSLIKALPDSEKYDVVLLKQLALENQKYPNASKHWQNEFLAAPKLLSLGERLISDYKNPNNSDDEKVIKYQSLLLFCERLRLFSNKKAFIEDIFGSENPLLGLIDKNHQKLNDFWDKKLAPIFNDHARYLTKQDSAEDKVLSPSSNLSLDSGFAHFVLPKIKTLVDSGLDFLQSYNNNFQELSALKSAIKCFEEITERLKGLLESKTANLKEV